MKRVLVIVLLLVSAPARADEVDVSDKTVLTSESLLAFDVGISKRWAQRFIGRVRLNDRDVENRGELHYGIAWKRNAHFAVDLTLGYAYSREGPDRQHAFVVGTWKHMSFLKDALMFRLEGLHVYDGRYRYEGFYAVDWWIAGAHAMNHGKEAAAGFQIGSGKGLLPFRFDIRISFGLTDQMPNRMGCFYMSFDVR